MAYLYRHIRLDKNEPFYIGIGSDLYYKRAYDLKNNRRNYIWNKIIQKTNIEVEIMLDNLSWEQVCEKEIEFIKFYGRIDKKNGILSNLTDGGDGSLGVIISSERKKMMSKRFSGEGNPMFGKKNSQESIEKGRLKNIGRIAWNKGKVGIYSDNSLIKMRESKIGKMAWNKGKKGVNGISNAKLVLNLENGVFYESCKEAASIYNKKHSTLKSKLNGTNSNNSSFIYA